MIFLQWPFSHPLKCMDFTEPSSMRIADFLPKVAALSGIPEDILIVHNGRGRLYSEDTVYSGSTLHITFALPGGKGGFGSMLRAIGAQIEKTTNREACRDLSGRRLRDINEEQRLKKWLAKKVEREKESERRFRERLERMKALPKHDFNDEEYNKQRSELPERIDDALSEGLKKKPKVVLGKKKADNSGAGPSSKKRYLWSDLDIPSDSSDEEKGGQSSDPASSNDVNDEDSRNSNSKDSTTNNSQGHQGDFDAAVFQKGDPDDQTVSEPIERSEDAMSSSIETDIAENASGTGKCAGESECSEVHISDSSGDLAVDEKYDLMSFESVEAMEQFGLEKLKSMLMDAGLKCGGTLTERAQRLWSVRGMDEKDYPANLRAKPKKAAKSAR